MTGSLWRADPSQSDRPVRLCGAGESGRPSRWLVGSCCFVMRQSSSPGSGRAVLRVPRPSSAGGRGGHKAKSRDDVIQAGVETVEQLGGEVPEQLSRELPVALGKRASGFVALRGERNERRPAIVRMRLAGHKSGLDKGVDQRRDRPWRDPEGVGERSLGRWPAILELPQTWARDSVRPIRESPSRVSSPSSRTKTRIRSNMASHCSTL